MEKLYLDLAISLFFLTALVIVSRTKGRVSQSHETSFGLLSAGLCVLALMSVYTAVQNQLIEVEMLKSTMMAMAEFIRLIMLVAGLVLVTSGISGWLPVFNRNSIDITVVERLAEKLIRTEYLQTILSQKSSPDEFVGRSLTFLVDNFGLNAGAVYSISAGSSIAKLIAGSGTFTLASDISAKFVINSDWLDSLNSSALTRADVAFSELAPNAPGGCYCFAIGAPGKRTFLYLIWATESHSIELIDALTLENLAAGICARTNYNRLEVVGEFNKTCRKAAEAMKSAMAVEQTLNRKLISVRISLNKLMPVDFVSVCSVHNSGMCRRLTIGPTDTVLNEMDIRPGPDNSYVQRVLEEHRMMSFADITSGNSVLFPELLSLSGIRSIAALPLLGTGNSKGVITIGLSDKHEFSRAELEMLNTCKGNFEVLLNEMNLIEQATVQLEREKLLREFVTEINESKSTVELYANVSATIARVTNCPIIRLSTVEPGGRFLDSQALINESSTKVRSPKNAHIILSLLYWHRTVVQNGNTVLVNCQSKSNGMPEVETLQVFGAGVNRAVIVPIKAHRRVIGLLSLAEEKNVAAGSLGDFDIQFVETIAALAGMAIEFRTQERAAISEFALAAKEEIVSTSKNRSVRSQLRSSLTSIIGSLEMLRGSGGRDEIQKGRFLEIIDKSARKLSEFISE